MMQPYPYDPDDGRENPNLEGTEKYVVRGGAWYYTRKLARCSTREGVLPTFLSSSLGLRLAMSLD